MAHVHNAELNLYYTVCTRSHKVMDQYWSSIGTGATFCFLPDNCKIKEQMSPDQLWERVFLHLIHLRYKWENNSKKLIQSFQKGISFTEFSFFNNDHNNRLGIFEMSPDHVSYIREMYPSQECQRYTYYVKKVISRFVNHHCSFLTSFFNHPHGSNSKIYPAMYSARD